MRSTSASVRSSRASRATLATVSREIGSGTRSNATSDEAGANALRRHVHEHA
jgi:hypothetical protein